jgi:LssY-like putative type I secretion system component LssY
LADGARAEAAKQAIAIERAVGHMAQVAGRRRWWIVLVGALVAYLLLAYIVLPALWKHHEHEPGLASLPMVTRTADGIPGDALNVGLVGSRDDVLRAMHAAGWFPADPITLRSSIEIVGSVVLDRPYHDAPVSPLYYQGKKEQLAFEKPEGKSADRRHHVRFWQVLDKGADGRPVWLGSVTFDRGVGLSHDTGQVTHHIAPDIDAERDDLMHDLREAGMVQDFFQISGTGPTLFGRNGEGDPYYTDGEIDVATLVIDGARQTTPPVTLPPPPLIALKDQIWHGVSNAMSH